MVSCSDCYTDVKEKLLTVVAIDLVVRHYHDATMLVLLSSAVSSRISTFGCTACETIFREGKQDGIRMLWKLCVSCITRSTPIPTVMATAWSSTAICDTQGHDGVWYVHPSAV